MSVPRSARHHAQAAHQGPCWGQLRTDVDAEHDREVEEVECIEDELRMSDVGAVVRDVAQHRKDPDLRVCEV
eukprot:2800815-Rhodomonas_salina.1